MENVGLVLLPSFGLLTLASITEPMRLANREAATPGFLYRTISIDGEPISSTDGFRLLPDASISNDDDLSTIVVVGSLQTVDFHDVRLANWLRTRVRYGAKLAPLGGAAFFAARIGLLDGYRCVTHWDLCDEFATRFPQIRLERSLYCIDRDRMTCAGGTAALDMGFAFVNWLTEPGMASRIADITLHGKPRPPDAVQRSDVRWRYGVSSSPAVGAIEMMERCLDRAIPIEELAARLGISRRKLERAFHRDLGETPSHFHLRLRLERARDLIRTSAVSLADIAADCGFADASHLGRRYRELFGQTPAQARSDKS
jgi:transcriptional regulator GlxA family with amidase domain